MNIAPLSEANIAWIEQGSGTPVLLVHGFASNAVVNWQETGWMDFLAANGFRAIAMDNRGHGQSSKFYEEAEYGLSKMAGDAALLLQHLNIHKTSVVGYSMGARISAVLAAEHPKLVERVVLSGNGYNMVEGNFPSENIREGLLAQSMTDITTDQGKSFRVFAKRTGGDLEALAACIMGARHTLEQSLFASLIQDVLVAVGTRDTVATGGRELADIIPNARFFPIPDKDHMSAVGDKLHKQAVLEFISI